MTKKYKLKEIEIGDTKVAGGVKSVVTDKDPNTGAISWSIDYVPNLTKLVEDVDELIYSLRTCFWSSVNEHTLEITTQKNIKKLLEKKI